MSKDEIHMPEDWSHGEQLKHIMSCAGEQPSHDWFGIGVCVILALAFLGLVMVVGIIGHFLGLT